MYTNFRDFLKKELADIEAAGLYKKERVITTPQRADIKVNAGEEVLNFCANNYLGLSDNTRLIEAAKKAMDTHGYGMSSVRFICGTQDLHKQLEALFVEHKTFTNNWKLPSLTISIQKIPSCMLHVLTQTVVCSNLFSQKKMLLFQTP